MIEPMEKIVMICREADQKRLLRLLREMGTLHLVPINSHGRTDLSTIESKLVTTKKAVRIAETVSGPTLGHMEPVDTVASRLPELQRELESVVTEIDRLTEQLERQERFGDLSQDDVDALAQAGLQLSFWRVPRNRQYLLAATGAVTIDDGSGKNYSMIAVEGDPPLELNRAEAQPLLFPKASAQLLKQELQDLRDRRSSLLIEKRRLAFHLPALESRCRSLEDTRQWQLALKDTFSDDALFAVSGWLPMKEKTALKSRIDAASIPTAVHFRAPEEDEQPPTLWTPPSIARPINALFRILGTIPGYRENDVSVSFMAALPLFCALLIADGGYGLLMVLTALLGLKLSASRKSREMAQLMLVIGGTAVVWGALTAAFFGFDIGTEAPEGSAPAPLYSMFSRIRIFEGSLSSPEVVNQMMGISFVLGAIHMSAARLWRGFRLLPSTEAIAQLGWAGMVWGMLLLTDMLVLDAPVHPWMVPLLGAGSGLVVLFSEPGKKLPTRLALGGAALPLGALGVLSDVISYIRLMAVGLASTILGATFNLLASQVAETSISGGAAVFVLGHSLNIALAMVALFAHGVRLNMLEFSNHLGMSWTGYPYKPFCFAGKEE